MPEFLSAAWLAALDEAVRAAPELRTDEPVVVEQVVRDDDGVEVRWRVRFGPSGATVDTGFDTTADDDADVVLVADRATAWALHEGALRAQDAFARGALKVRGRPEVLTGRAELFAALARALAPVRAGTTEGGDR
jgi:hypothetical protein